MYLYELKHEDADRRIEAVRNLETVAVALGADRTREELIPYISGLFSFND